MKKRILSMLLCLVLCAGLFPATLAAMDEAQQAADALNGLGLFQGVGDNADGTPNFDLDRTPMRSEAVTMLVRLLGKEEEAKTGAWETPFTDVPAWAAPYVGYAYANGLTTGTGATTFGSDTPMDATQYLTFVLRALGYKSGEDFAWNAAWELSDRLGITHGEYSAENTAFVRGDVAIISNAALQAEYKDGSSTLLEALEAAGAVQVKPATEAEETPAEESLYISAPVEEIDWRAMLDFPDPVPKESNPEERMAHNIYSDPVLSGTGKKYSGFLIDFKADYAPICTYWALCNWEMDASSLKNEHTVTDAGGAYAGLQNTEEGKKAIMSFWEIHYLDKEGTDQVLRASRIYPATDRTDTFGGEGEGTNYIVDFPWETGKWYRMYLCCYDDTETGHTIVEQWVEDIEIEEWTQVSGFDTGLTGSCFIGDMSQFMENYWYAYSNEVRSFAYRNLYVRKYQTGEWVPTTSSVLSVDTWWDNKKGSFALGADVCTLYGITCGYGPDTAQLNEDIHKIFSLELTEPPHTPDESGH